MLTEIRINVYEPLSWVVKAWVVALSGGLDPAALGTRRVSLGLHAINATILMMVCDHLLTKQDKQPSQHPFPPTQRFGRAVCSFAGAAIYAVHPVHAEVMGWPSAQPYTLASFFTLLATLLYLRAHHPLGSGHTVLSGQKHSRYNIGSVCCYFFALLSKAASVPFPAICMAIELVLGPLSVIDSDSKGTQTSVMRGQALWAFVLQTLQRCTVYLLLGFSFMLATLFANTDGTDPQSDVIAFNFPQRIIKAQVTMWMYVKLLFWPVGLRPHYSIIEEDLDLFQSPEALLSCVQFWAISISVVILFIRGALKLHFNGAPRGLFWPLAAWGVYVAFFLPTCGLVQHGMVQKGGDRYAYLAYLPIAPLLSGVLYHHLKHLFNPSFLQASSCQKVARERENPVSLESDESFAINNERRNLALFLLAVCGSLGPLVWSLMVLSNKQVQLWRSDETMFLESIRIDPQDWRMLDTYAELLAHAGRMEEAEPFLHRASEATPTTTAKGFLSKTKNLVFLGKYQEACDLYKASLEKFANSPHILHNIAICQMVDRNYAAVPFTFEQALLLSRTKSQKDKIQENFRAYLEWEESGFQGDYKGSIMW